MAGQVDVKAPKGKYRVIEVDVCYADGYLGDPEESLTLLGDYRWLWVAKLAACRKMPWRWLGFQLRKIVTSRFARQIHNESGECIFYFHNGRELKSKRRS